MTVAEDLVSCAAVRTDIIRKILYDPDDRNVHQLRHFDCLFDNHGYQLLRRGHDDQTVQRQRLEYRQRDVTSTRRHVHIHHIDVTPDHIVPELVDDPGQHRTAPDNRIGRVLQKRVDGNHLDACFGNHRCDLFIRTGRLAPDAERLRDRRPGNIRIQNRDLIA